MSLDEKDRREMGKDWIERDRMLTSVDTKLSSLITTVDNYIAKDDREHKDIKKRVFLLTLAVVIIGVVLGGPSFAMMFIK